MRNLSISLLLLYIGPATAHMDSVSGVHLHAEALLLPLLLAVLLWRKRS